MGRFNYVENMKSIEKKKKKKHIKVQLSVAAKTKQRKQDKKSEKEQDEKDEDVEMKEVKKEDKKEEEPKEKEKEKESEFNFLSNPSRVTPNQVKYVQWIDKRYKPLTFRLSGFVMVEDTKPDQEIEFVQQKEIGTGGVYGDEPKPPKPFKYLGN